MISIVIPTYNRADLLLETLKSLRAQDFQDFETIVVDDGSSDDTRQRIEDFAAFPNFHYVYQENQGRSAARNHGLRIATRQYVMFLDSDDLLTTGSLAKLNELSVQFPESGVVAGGRKYIDENGNFLDITDELAITEDFSDKRVLLEKIRSFFLPPSSYIVKKSLAEELNGFDSSLEPCEDLDFFLRFCDASKISLTKEVVLHMRRHTGNTPQPHIFNAIMKIAKMNYESLKINSQNYSPELLKKMMTEWQLKIADDYYATGEKLKAYKHYFTAIKISPEIVFERKVYKSILLNSIPASLKTK